MVFVRTLSAAHMVDRQFKLSYNHHLERDKALLDGGFSQ